MPRGDRLLFKFTGDGTERHHGIPMRDILESDRDSLTDAQMVTLAASPIYSARNDADEEAEAAAKRIEKADAPDPLAVDTVPAVSMPASKDAPKTEAKK